MAAKRHKFKLYLLSQQISARTIQRYIHNWFHHQGSHFLSNHPAVTVISLNNCTNPPNSPISHNNSPNENNTTPSQNIDNTLTSNQENIDRRIINHRIARHQYHLENNKDKDKSPNLMTYLDNTLMISTIIFTPQIMTHILFNVMNLPVLML